MKGLNVENAVLFKQLLLVEDSSQKLSQSVLKIVSHVTPLLARIPENMREYTLHDETHSLKIIRIMGRIIPPETLVQLNDIELTFLILAAFLHDIGMTCSLSEKERIILGSSEYQNLMKIDPIYEDYLEFKKTNNHRAVTRIEDKIFTEYLRRNHVKRSAEFIETTLLEGEFKLAINDILLFKYLINICDSHGEPVSCLKDNRRYPRNTLIGEKYVNIQYVSLILRMADILDLDPERTPKVIYDFVSPEDPTSVIEWKKHRSIIGWDISSNRVVFEAECTSPEVERALRIFMEWIEIERKESIDLLKNYHDEISSKYLLLLQEPINMERIGSDGSYIYSDVKFHLHYEKIIELLMGQRLYRSPITALRELLQNAIDAIKARMFLGSDKLERFEPKVTIEYKNDTLIIEDNGIGMDDDVFNEFFLQVGTSYYKHPRFFDTDLDVVSEFGIGVLSAFMVADSMVIESRMEPENPLVPPLPIYYEIPTAHSYCVKRHSERVHVGTKISLKLKKGHPFSEYSIVQVIEEIIPHPDFPIFIKTTDQEFKHSGVSIVENSLFNEHLDKESFSIDRRRNLELTDESFTHYLFDVDLGNLGDIEIEGKLQVVNGSNVRLDGEVSGCITQRSFNLGIPHTSEGNFKLEISKSLTQMFPYWLNIFADINIVGRGSLAITPDRTEVIQDERFKKIKMALEHAIISGFQKHLDEYKENHSLNEYHNYVDLLFEAGFIEVRSHYNEAITEEAQIFFQKYLSFPVITEKGTLVRKFGAELLSYERLGIIESYNVEEFTNEMNDFVTKHKEIPIIILNGFNIRQFYNMDNLVYSVFLDSQINNKLSMCRYLLSPIPGIEIEILCKYDLKKKDSGGPNRFEVAEEILFDIENKSSQVICIPVDSGAYEHIFNKSHPIITPLLQGSRYKNIIAERIFHKLKNSFKNIMVEYIDSIDDPENAKLQYALRNSSHALLSTGLFSKDSGVYTKMKEAIDLHWTEMTMQGFVKELDYPEIGFSDFPWYWGAEKF
ncbi:HD domain-containing protein [Paenibacillus amylolyticus]|uniref:HD domain-containing protein n=1 Tax=Paenibacillus amylolyticus TaxID=1451 RepID=UPI003EC095E8